MSFHRFPKIKLHPLADELLQLRPSLQLLLRSASEAVDLPFPPVAAFGGPDCTVDPLMTGAV